MSALGTLFPFNPTGKVMSKEELCQVVELSKKYNFKILSDECYIDIYFRDKPFSSSSGR